MAFENLPTKTSELAGVLSSIPRELAFSPPGFCFVADFLMVFVATLGPWICEEIRPFPTKKGGNGMISR